MMKRYNILVSLVVSISFSFQLGAQTVEELPKLRELKGKDLEVEITPLQHKKGLWGYGDAEGKFVIRAVFDEVRPYEGKVARICYNGKWGLINEKAQYVMQPLFCDSISVFSEDSLAIIRIGGKWGLINNRSAGGQKTQYDGITYADYGYYSFKDGKYGTINHKGKTILEPQFDTIVALDRDRKMEMIRQGKSWGLLQEGSTVLSLRIDEPLELLQKGRDGHPDLYLAVKDGKMGVVTLGGDFVAPCVYDEITKHGTGNYYVVRQGDRYGAISLKMTELLPPVLSTPPVLKEDIFRFYNDGEFYAVNIKGAIPFRDCADLYEVFNPQEYRTTTSIPAWSKATMIAENVQNHDAKIERARQVVKILKENDYDANWSALQTTMPKEFKVWFPDDETEQRYGIIKGRTFQPAMGSMKDRSGRYLEILYVVSSSDRRSQYLTYDPATGESFISVGVQAYPLKDAFAQMDVSQFSSFYPKDFVILENGDIMVRLSLITSSSEVPGASLSVHREGPVKGEETDAVVIFNHKDFSVRYCCTIQDGKQTSLYDTRFGGIYLGGQGDIIADEHTPLRRIDDNGVEDWRFIPDVGEQFYDIEETENFVYLCGSVKNMITGGVERPLIVQISKRGERVKDYVLPYDDAYSTGIICKDHLLYIRATFKKNKAFGEGYYPLMVLDDMGDNFGVNLTCLWEDWGGRTLGGAALIASDGTILSSPVLPKDDVCYMYDWEFGAFTSDYLVVVYKGKYGLLDRTGKITIETKYELLEALDNPSYFRFRKEGRYGVIDADGRIIVPAEYDYIGGMAEDVIVARANGLYGCFDKNGKVVVPFEYEEIREYVGGQARIRLMQRFGFIDKVGNIVVAPFSDEVENFTEGLALVTIKNKLGFVNPQGDWVAVPMYDDACAFSGGLAYVSHNGKYGYIDKTGTFVIPMQYDKATAFNQTYEMACVSLNGKWGIISKDGKVVVPIEYDAVEISADGFVSIKSGGKYGIYSREGKMIYPAVCESIKKDMAGRMFQCGAADASQDGQRIRVDVNGNLVYQYSSFVETTGPQYSL